MSKPVIADRQPTVLKLEPGTYFWCACGQSSDQPFCDGSHKGSGFTPQKVVIEEEKSVALCNCKHTQKPPFCDGTHSQLPKE